MSRRNAEIPADDNQTDVWMNSFISNNDHNNYIFRNKDNMLFKHPWLI